MGGSYRQCGQCGKRALSIATRCPGCGRELLAPAASGVDRAPGLRGLLSSGVVGMIVALAILLLVAEFPRFHRTLEQRASLVAADSTPATSQVRYTSVAAARLDTATAAPPTPASVGEVLVARTWTKVHKSRDKVADVEAVLLPGDSVLADSLERSWYRVALDGTVIGYVHRSTLVHP